MDKEHVRHWLQRRWRERSALPSLEQVRAELGWPGPATPAQPGPVLFKRRRTSKMAVGTWSGGSSTSKGYWMASTLGQAGKQTQNDAVAETPRRRGRPSKRECGPDGEHAELSRNLIIEHAVRLSREVSLDDISIVQLAKDLAVTPATIHYHLAHGRDELLSEVVTIYMRHILHCFDKVEGEWEERVRTVALRLFRVHIEFKGVNAYLMKHNKFRLLQTASRDDQDLGVRYMDRFILLFKEHGFDIEACVINVHQLAFFIASCAQAEIGRQLPAYHKKYLVQELSSQRLQGAPYFREALSDFMEFDTDKMFLTGIDILLRGFSAPKAKNKRRASGSAK